MRTVLATLFVLLSGCVVQTELERTYYGKWEADIGYTQVVRSGNTLYLSGVVGSGESVLDQVRSVYTTISEVLADFDAGTEHIVKEVVFTTDMEAMRAAIPIRKEFFKEDQYPAATWVQIERLFSPGAMVEVDVTAVLP